MSNWSEEDGGVIAYMCTTDWEVELGMADGGCVLFASPEGAKEKLRCVEGCGITEVKVYFNSVIQEPDSDEILDQLVEEGQERGEH